MKWFKKHRERIIAFVMLAVLLLCSIGLNPKSEASAATSLTSGEFTKQFIAEALARVGMDYPTASEPKGHTDPQSLWYDCGGLVGACFTALGFGYAKFQVKDDKTGEFKKAEYIDKEGAKKDIINSSWGFWGSDQWQGFYAREKNNVSARGGHETTALKEKVFFDLYKPPC